MITYRKKSLKVHNIKATAGKYNRCHSSWESYVAEMLKVFIEKGEYSRIADIFFYGNNEELTCSIIYEEVKDSPHD